MQAKTSAFLQVQVLQREQISNLKNKGDMITTSKFSEVAKVLKGLAAVYSVQYESSFIESDMKIDIDTIKKEFANCNGKKYGFALTIGIRKSGTNSSLGSMFRTFLDDGEFVALFTLEFDNHTKIWNIKKETKEEECYY